VGGFGIDLFDFQVDLAQIIGQLIFPSLDIRINLFDL